jgi:hypothetical protein
MTKKSFECFDEEIIGEKIDFEVFYFHKCYLIINNQDKKYLDRKTYDFTYITQ